MVFKRALLVVAIVFIFVLCFTHMNDNFDVLSRYPYQNEENRELIRNNLDDVEIEYIIEFDIAPAYFIEYVTYDGFDIYHIDRYNTIKDADPSLSDKEVVELTEEMIALDLYDEIVELSTCYDVKMLMEFYADDVGGTLACPIELSSRLDDQVGVYRYTPEDLTEKEILDQKVILRKEAITKLEEMMTKMQDDIADLSSFVFTHSYVSYDNQASLDGDDVCSSYASGHSDHQLGLAFDYEADEEISSWLSEHAYEYGFVSDGKTFHLRYIGDGS